VVFKANRAMENSLIFVKISRYYLLKWKLLCKTNNGASKRLKIASLHFLQENVSGASYSEPILWTLVSIEQYIYCKTVDIEYRESVALTMVPCKLVRSKIIVRLSFGLINAGKPNSLTSAVQLVSASNMTTT